MWNLTLRWSLHLSKALSDVKWAIPEKKPNRGGWGYTFLKEIPGIFRFVILPIEIPEKTSFHPWKFCKVVWHPLEIPSSKTKTYGNSIWVFLEDPWKFHFFFNWPLEFQYAVSSVALGIPCFFLDSPINDKLKTAYCIFLTVIWEIRALFGPSYPKVPWKTLRWLLHLSKASIDVKCGV